MQAGRFALATVGGDPDSATVDRIHDIPGKKSSDTQRHRGNKRGGHAQDQADLPAQRRKKSRRHPGLDFRKPGFGLACFPAKRPALISNRIEGNGPHLFLRKELSSLRIIPFRALRQSIRIPAAAFLATLCLAPAAQAQIPSTPPPVAASAALRPDAFERQLVVTAGQAVTVTFAGRAEEAVFYAPLSVLCCWTAPQPNPPCGTRFT